MIDTHAHIDFNAFDEDRNEMIGRALSEGVERIIIPAVEPKDFGRLLALSQEYDFINCALGVHPHNASDCTDAVLSEMKTLSAANSNVVAIGETGLDYYYDFQPKDIQQNSFRQQLKLARELDLPVIVHNREADEDVLRIIAEEKDERLNCVLHCFSSSVNVMEKAIEMGLYLSFTGNITFKKSNLGDVVAKVPLDKIMIETDSPFMTPVPHRGKRNEPVFVGLVAAKIAEIKSVSIEEVISMTTKNAGRFFKLAIMIVFLLLSFQSGFAQRIRPYQPQDDSVEVDEDQYRKFIGFGPMLGFNTIVTSYTTIQTSSGRDVTSEGVLCYGGTLIYSIIDHSLVSFSFGYSKTDKPTKMWGLDPFTYQFYEFSNLWTPNPYSRINFFGQIGATYIKANVYREDRSGMAINAGLGFMANMKTDYGLFNVMLEWKLNFDLNSQTILDPNFLVKDTLGNIITDVKYPGYEQYKPFKSSSFYSVPRLTLVYYPKFW